VPPNYRDLLGKSNVISIVGLLGLKLSIEIDCNFIKIFGPSLIFQTVICSLDS
jgi:hypothetical protein